MVFDFYWFLLPYKNQIVCQTHLRLQSYKKYFKYTISLCKIHNINKHAIKKREDYSSRLAQIYSYGSSQKHCKDTKNN